MTREDIEQMMSDAGLKAPARGAFIFIHWDQIAMLLAHERELRAKVAAGYDAAPWKHCQTSTHAADIVSASIAAAIRARGNK